MTLPPVVRALQVARPPAAAFALFTEHLGAWWPLGSHGVFADGAADVALRDGTVVERSADGRAGVWAEVLGWEPPHRVRLAWHPGGSAGAAGIVDVRFEPVAPDGAATRVELTHSGWEVFGTDAAAVRRRYEGPDAWGAVLDHFADLAARDPAVPALPGLDLAALAAAYETFYAEAEAGGFGEPAPGEWTAEQVTAHVAVNDGLLAAVTRAVIAERVVRLENLVSTDAGTLDGWVREHGDLAALAAAGRERAQLMVHLVSRLDERLGATAVPTRLVHGGEVMVDTAMPWGRILEIQLANHLPGHTAQLRGLRPTS